MTHRMAIEDLLYRRNIARPRSNGPVITQEELERQKASFFAAGGTIQQIPTGQSGEVFKMKRSTAPGDQHIWAKVPIKAG